MQPVYEDFIKDLAALCVKHNVGIHVGPELMFGVEDTVRFYANADVVVKKV